MTQEAKFKKIDRNNLPIFYRIILKVPVPKFMNRIDIPSGIFWAMVVPIGMFFTFFLNMYFLLQLSFPINLVVVCILPSAMLLILARATANRFIDWWNSVVVGGYVQREIRKVLDEYISLQQNEEKPINGKTSDQKV